MHVTFVSTYPPTTCGLATFTQNLRKAVVAHSDVEGAVVAVKNTKTPSRPLLEEVFFEVRRSVAQDYRAAAEFINFTGTDVVNLQHEFGIFGGNEGNYIVPFLKRLQKPVVTTFHTVLASPPEPYRRALLAVAEHSDQLAVMSEKARAILCDVYGLSATGIHVIHHGVPDLPFESTEPYKKRFGLEGRTVVMTFGLLGPSKGIELVLEALPEVVQAHPDALYVILGATHPEVKRQKGEAYRRQLMRRVQQFGLEKHVRFIDRYVTREELHDYLQACDVYVTPYPGREQISSGTLAYALGAGRAVVSTPYFYAEELLDEGRGWLVDFDDDEEMSRALHTLIGNPERREAMRRAAYNFGRRMTWPHVGEQYATLFAKAGQQQKRYPRRKADAAQQRIAPAHVTLDYLAVLTDDTGIFQHASYGIPERQHGYCTDDAARALVVALAYHTRRGDRQSLDLARTYLSFLQHAQREDGHFHNFMNFARAFTDVRGSEDTVGRALWGLGAAVAWGPTTAMRVLARQMCEHAMYQKLTHPRALAYALCGFDLFLKRYPGATEVQHRVRALADQLADQYEQAHSDDWRWFHDALTYANAKLPQAMLMAYEATGEERYKIIGLEALSFLVENTYHEGQFEFVGNRGWYLRGGECASFGQQSIEAGYMAEACMAAYKVTGRPRYYTLAQAAAEWFFGRNCLGRSLYDPETGTCLDGLEAWGPNLNQGAESTIVCLLGLLAVTEGLSDLPAGYRTPSDKSSRILTSSLS